MPKKSEKQKSEGVTTRSAAKKMMERKAGAAAAKARKVVRGERFSLRIKERERAAGAGLGLGLVLGGVGGWAVGRSMSEADVRYVRQLEARNRFLEAELARRR